MTVKSGDNAVAVDSANVKVDSAGVKVDSAGVKVDLSGKTADDDDCVAKCVRANQMRAVGADQIERDCKAECKKQK